ncbi:MAG: hypothetical protein ACK5JT_07555, partial [Hyphomicrobiaceae bacterium]
ANQIALHKAHVGSHVGGLAVGLPVALYIATVWLIRDRVCFAGWRRYLLLVASLVVIAIAQYAPAPVAMIALMLVITVTVRRCISE